MMGGKVLYLLQTGNAAEAHAAALALCAQMADISSAAWLRHVNLLRL